MKRGRLTEDAARPTGTCRGFEDDMGSDRLDAVLEPLAQFLLLIILLLVVAAVSTYILTKAAARRRERRHRALSASKRLKETGIDLLARAEEDDRAPENRRKRRSGSGRRSQPPREHQAIDILRKAEYQSDENSSQSDASEPRQ
jgi:hypothetical protein